ncbi:MAG: hypothetical protein ACKVQW_10045 [Pyrinomonadaceae bacterium]
MRKQTLIVSFLILIGFGCNKNSNIYTLPSGKQINVTSITKMDFPKGDPALVMKYETNIPIEKKLELRREVDEIWKMFQKDVEAANLKAAAIRAIHNEGDGFVRTGKGYGFVFIKQDDGTWYCLDDKAK